MPEPRHAVAAHVSPHSLCTYALLCMYVCMYVYSVFMYVCICVCATGKTSPRLTSSAKKTEKRKRKKTEQIVERQAHRWDSVQGNRQNENEKKNEKKIFLGYRMVTLEPRGPEIAARKSSSVMPTVGTPSTERIKSPLSRIWVHMCITLRTYVLHILYTL